MQEADMGRTWIVSLSGSLELGKDSEESDIIDVEDLSCRGKSENTFLRPC